MKTLFIPAEYKAKIKLPEAMKKELAKHKNIILTASVQFVSQIDNIAEDLKKSGIDVRMPDISRAKEKGQLLGCNVYYSNYNTIPEDSGALVYLGDGKFHPKALLLMQKDSKEIKPVYWYDPIDNDYNALDINDIERALRKYRAMLMKFLEAKNIGVFLSTKPGQHMPKKVDELTKKFPKKKIYRFLGDSFNKVAIDEFNFIDCWINTACPRIALEDLYEKEYSMINIDDAVRVNKLLSKDCLLTNV